MYDFITDSVFLRKKKGFIFANSIFSWKIKKNKEDYEIVSHIHDIKLRSKLSNTELIAVVSPSNYKLLYDLKHLKVKKTYMPEFYENGKLVKFDNVYIVEQFNNFLKRGYLSFLNYGPLSKMGFNRIEQFIICLRILASENMILHDNVLLPQESYVHSSSFLKSKTVLLRRLRFSLVIGLLSKEMGLNFQQASKLLLQLYGELLISDPFHPEGFVVLRPSKEHSEILNLLKRLLNRKISYDVYILEVGDKDKKRTTKISIKKLSKGGDKIIDKYLLFQKEDYFEGKILNETGKPSLSHTMLSFLKFFPVKDTALTLKSLIKLEKIEEIDGSLRTSKLVKKRLSVKENMEWINVRTWEEIYKRDISDFNYFLNEIYSKKVIFKCPVCDEEDISSTPMRFFCTSSSCNFAFDRTTLNIVGVKSVDIDKMEEAFSNKAVFVKNSNGKNFISYLKNNKDYYFLSLKK